MYGLMRLKPYRRARRFLRKPWVAFKTWAADSGVPLTENDAKLTRLKGSAKGRRCFVIGNGPSLRVADLDRLQGEITLAANKIYLAFDQTAWRPDYYFVMDREVAENNRDVIAGLQLDKYTTNLLRPLFRGADFTYFEIRGGSRYDVRLGLDAGATVVSSMVQFAYFMGCAEIYLVGVDFSFVLPSESQECNDSGELVLVSNGEQNHFIANYRAPGERWTFPRLDVQKAFFERQASFMRSREGRDVLFNASRQTRLDVLPKRDFDSLFVPEPVGKSSRA